jgi:NADH dehydrogenase
MASRTNTSSQNETAAGVADAGRQKDGQRVLVTGATGFVGRAVVRELVAAGHKPVCLARHHARRRSALGDQLATGLETISGGLFDAAALAKGVSGVDAVIHLVGIIAEDRRQGQTFERVHVEGTQRVLTASGAAGVRRFVHMSAMGTRPNAVSRYHQTKWAAECLVRDSDLDWIIFRPSLIHGPDGEFMRVMRRLVCDATIPLFGFVPVPFPILPHFGDGLSRIQPVSVLDVARCCVAALRMPQAVRQTYELGGPEVMTWRELYRICRELIPGAKGWKPVLGQPVWAAKLMAMTMMKLPIFPRAMRFNVDQIVMSQEDSVGEVQPVEATFGIKLRGFRDELRRYAWTLGRENSG